MTQMAIPKPARITIIFMIIFMVFQKIKNSTPKSKTAPSIGKRLIGSSIPKKEFINFHPYQKKLLHHFLSQYRLSWYRTGTLIVDNHRPIK